MKNINKILRNFFGRCLIICLIFCSFLLTIFFIVWIKLNIELMMVISVKMYEFGIYCCIVFFLFYYFDKKYEKEVK